MTTDPANPEGPAPASAPRSRAVVQGLCLAVGLFTIYTVNGREVGSGDTVPAKYLTVALVRGDGFFLDDYRAAMLAEWPYRGAPYYFKEVGGHCVSTYPVGAAVLAAPFTWAQMVVLDRAEPGWEHSAPGWFSVLAKRSAAAIASLTAVALWVVLRRLGLGREAWAAVAAAALGSNLWETASQSLWQHGPAALSLTVLVLLVLPEAPSGWRFALAGVAAALMVCSRPIDLPFAIAASLWVAYRRPRRLIWFLPPAVAIGTALIVYNRTYLGAAGGLYSQFDAASFATPLLKGLGGTLLSPNRGLFVFSPWTLVAVAYVPSALRRLGARSIVSWLMVAIIAHAVIISKFSIWWAGASFGPRFWTDVIPLLAVVFGLALRDFNARSRPLLGLSIMLVAVSVAIQALGAAVYPSGWNQVPRSVDRDPERVWSWSDTELGRCARLSRLYRFFAKTPEVRPTRPVTPAAPSTPTAVGRRRAPTAPAGTLDRVDCQLVQGWVWDADQPDAVIAVDLYDDDTRLGTVMADRYRQDLERAGIGNGKHGFVWNTPAQIADGKRHTIHARVSGTGTELAQSPKPLSCPSQGSQAPLSPR